MKHKEPHKYLRAATGKDGGYIIYRCIISPCTHYLPEAQMIGQTFTCGRCEEEDTVRSKDDLLIRYPLKCRNCRKVLPDVSDEVVLKAIETAIKENK